MNFISHYTQWNTIIMLTTTIDDVITQKYINSYFAGFIIMQCDTLLVLSNECVSNNLE